MHTYLTATPVVYVQPCIIPNVAHPDRISGKIDPQSNFSIRIIAHT